MQGDVDISTCACPPHIACCDSYVVLHLSGPLALVHFSAERPASHGQVHMKQMKVLMKVCMVKHKAMTVLIPSNILFGGQ